MKAVTFRLLEENQELLKSYADECKVAQAEAIRIAIQNLKSISKKEPQTHVDKSPSPTVDALINQLSFKDAQNAALNARCDDITKEDKLNAMFGMTAEELDARAQAYENDEIEFTAEDELRSGSPLDYIRSKRETFVLDISDFRGVTQVMWMDGCSKSTVYRTALHEYLENTG